MYTSFFLIHERYPTHNENREEIFFFSVCMSCKFARGTVLRGLVEFLRFLDRVVEDRVADSILAEMWFVVFLLRGRRRWCFFWMEREIDRFADFDGCRLEEHCGRESPYVISVGRFWSILILKTVLCKAWDPYSRQTTYSRLFLIKASYFKFYYYFMKMWVD